MYSSGEEHVNEEFIPKKPLQGVKRLKGLLSG